MTIENGSFSPSMPARAGSDGGEMIVGNRFRELYDPVCPPVPVRTGVEQRIKWSMGITCDLFEDDVRPPSEPVRAGILGRIIDFV